MFSPLHMEYNDQIQWNKTQTKEEPSAKQLAFFDPDLLGSQIQAVPHQQFYHHSLQHVQPPDLTSFNCNSSGMHMGLWGEPNASNFPSLNAEAFRSSQRQNLRELYSRTAEDQAFTDQFNSDAAFSSLFQPIRNPTQSQSFKSFIPSLNQSYVPPDNQNAFLQFPGNTVTNQNPMAQKQRINSWTSQEEAFLIGVVVAKYLSQGSLFGNEENPKKRARDEGKKSKSSAIEGCWVSIKEAFDNVWDRYKAKTGFGRPCERTAQALSRHYKVMKTKLKTGKQRSFHSLYCIWRNEFDFNHSLLHPDYFAIQDHLKKKTIHGAHGSMKSILDEGRSLTPALSEGDLQASFYQGEQFQRVNSWNKHEETILVGVVVDRFIKRGSLVSPRKTSDDDEEDSDCWSTIKRSYDLAWNRFTEASGVGKPLDRTVNALSRHYKVLRSRLTSNVKSMLDQNQDSMLVAKETKQNLTLSQIYDAWVTNYNSNDALISPDEQ